MFAIISIQRSSIQNLQVRLWSIRIQNFTNLLSALKL